MKTIKIKINKWIIYGLIFLLACSLFFAIPRGYAVQAKELEKIEFEQKIYSKATIQDNFDDSSVIVIMDKKVGGLNVKHNIFDESYFTNLEDPSKAAEQLLEYSDCYWINTPMV